MEATQASDEAAGAAPAQLPVIDLGVSSTESDASFREEPHISWSDAIRAADAWGRDALPAYVAFANYLSNYTPRNVDVQLLSVRVTQAGDIHLWLLVRFGPRAAGDAAAGDLRPSFRVQVTVSYHVLEHIGAADPWAAARS